MLTGARQTGKTTLARAAYSDSLHYLDFEDLTLRSDVEAMHAREWATRVGPAILDEVHTAPSALDKVGHAYDTGGLDFTVLLGSSRSPLLDRVRESLAGRASLYDLWPLMLCELAAKSDQDVERPLLSRLIASGTTEILAEEPVVRLGGDERARSAFRHLERWGGMPELLHLSGQDRRTWFRSFQQTFVERDLSGLVRLADLQPFCKFQHLAMQHSGELVNYASLGDHAQISPATARRYLEYLHLTYQVILLRPYPENLTSQVVKSPKLYWSDIGLLRGGTERWGDVDGKLFETLVVAECKKWISSGFEPARLFFYRTRSGQQVDLLIKTPDGILGLEIRNRETTVGKDLRALRAIA
ncbi:MAG: AAA family ATPase, partial [Thermoanaerobaculia bacterium]|nr:AAA family ATPase [Thermoanaerobaculia bacterium]